MCRTFRANSIQNQMPTAVFIVSTRWWTWGTFTLQHLLLSELWTESLSVLSSQGRCLFTFSASEKYFSMQNKNVHADESADIQIDGQLFKLSKILSQHFTIPLASKIIFFVVHMHQHLIDDKIKSHWSENGNFPITGLFLFWQYYILAFL